MIKKILLSQIFIFIFFQSVIGQNIFDFKNSLLFANYLFDTESYETAAIEYERCLNMKDTLYIKQKLLSSYRKSMQFDKGLNKIKIFKKEFTTLDPSLIEEELKINMMAGNYVAADSIISNSNLVSNQLYKIKNLLLSKNFDKASDEFKNSDSFSIDDAKSIEAILSEYLLLPKKNVLKAKVLSGIVPGLGKVYTNDWKDGAISFLTTGSLAFQSYRGFKLDGNKSIKGWILGGISLGFYIGNIYGSGKAARQFNKKNYDQFYSKAKFYSLNNF